MPVSVIRRTRISITCCGTDLQITHSMWYYTKRQTQIWTKSSEESWLLFSRCLEKLQVNHQQLLYTSDLFFCPLFYLSWLIVMQNNHQKLFGHMFFVREEALIISLQMDDTQNKQTPFLHFSCILFCFSFKAFDSLLLSLFIYFLWLAQRFVSERKQLASYAFLRFMNTTDSIIYRDARDCKKLV